MAAKREISSQPTSRTSAAANRHGSLAGHKLNTQYLIKHSIRHPAKGAFFIYQNTLDAKVLDTYIRRFNRDEARRLLEKREYYENAEIQPWEKNAKTASFVRYIIPAIEARAKFRRSVG